jgi:hypothetical protein
MTAGNPAFGDRIDPRQMTPEELLAEILEEDFLTRENRKRKGLPESDLDDVADLEEALPDGGAIGKLLGERRQVKKRDQQP